MRTEPTGDTRGHTPEYIGCVMTCLADGGIDDGQAVFMCLGGCYAATYLGDERDDDGEYEGNDENEN